MSSKTSLKQSSMTINANKDPLMELNDMGDEQPATSLTELINTVNDNFAQMLAIQEQNFNSLQAQKHEELITQLTRPKQIVRGADGRIVGVK